MKSKSVSIVISIIIVASLSNPISQNVGQPSPRLSGTVGLMLSDISAPIPQISGQPSSTSNGTGGLGNSPWPMFRQNLNHTGLSPYDTSENNGQLKWCFTTEADIESSPGISSDGTIYIGSYDKNLYAINGNGIQKWNFTTGGPIHSSPLVGSDGTIYIGSVDNKLYAINPDGTQKWNFTTDWTIASSPAIDSDGTVYVGSYDHKLYAINSDGTEKWNFTTGFRIWSSPAISSDGTIYIGSGDNKLYAINIDGTQKWNFTTGDNVDSSPAIGYDGTIYIGSQDNKLYAINLDGTQKWNFTTYDHIFSSPAIDSNGTIYIGSLDNKLYAINPDGSEKWNFTTGWGVISSPAIGSDGTIYVGSQDNKLYAINLDGTEKWNFTTYDNIFSSPAIDSKGTVYIGSGDTKLYAIGKTDIPPIADAGPDQTVNEGDTVLLDGSDSIGSSGHLVRDPSVVALWHMNESSGNVIYDETDNHHDGTIINATWTTDGKFGNALSFDGVDDYVKIKPSDQIFGDNPDEWSYMVWFKTSNDVDNMSILSDYSSGEPVWSWNNHTHAIELILARWLYGTDYDNPYVWASYGYKNGRSRSGRPYNYPDDNWHFVAMTFSNKGNKIYSRISVNDDMGSGSTITYSGAHRDYFDGDTLYIGTRWVLDPPGIPGTGDVFYPFQGSIDEIVLFNRSLSPEEVLDYYYSGKEYSLDRYDIPAEIETYEWDFESDGIYDYQETVSNAPDGAFDGITNHAYGDDGIFKATLRVTDNQNLTDTDTCNITVLNVDPKVTIESAIMDVEIGLRVPGRKYNNVSMTLFEEGNPIDYVSIERMPGSPNDQMAWIPITLDMTKTYSAIVTYTPEDPPNVGGNPVWIYIKSQNGSVRKIHHTFNVQQSKKRNSDHWNHVEPWEVDLSAHFIGLPFEITSHITDPGSDDETLTFSYGSQVVTITYLNNPPNPDPFPSPEVKPVDIMDSTTLVYEGPGTVTLQVEDDDAGTAIITMEMV